MQKIQKNSVFLAIFAIFTNPPKPHRKKNLCQNLVNLFLKMHFYAAWSIKPKKEQGFG